MQVKDPSGPYVLKVLIYFDIFVASLFARDPDVTISSYCGLALRAKSPGFGQICLRGLGHVLNFISRDHCETAIKNDTQRALAAWYRLTGNVKE